VKWIVAGVLIWLVWHYLRPKPKSAPGRGPGPATVTDEAEARSILGVERGADAAAIRSAHRRLVASVHPDRGGSTDLTRRVNAARDLLLKQRG